MRRHAELLAEWLGERARASPTSASTSPGTSRASRSAASCARALALAVERSPSWTTCSASFDLDQPFPADVLGQPRGRTTGARHGRAARGLAGRPRVARPSRRRRAGRRRRLTASRVADQASARAIHRRTTAERAAYGLCTTAQPIERCVRELTKYVYDFAEGNKDLKDLLGGKGANLAEMTNLGLPVPPGFTITTEACQAYLQAGREPAELAAEVERAPGCARADDGQAARASPTTRCWCRCGPARSSRCPG